MELLKIVRPDNTVICSIMYDRHERGYRFINLTHNHICECVFLSIEDAMKDLEEKRENGDVLEYSVIFSNKF